MENQGFVLIEKKKMILHEFIKTTTKNVIKKSEIKKNSVFEEK
jgi:hypothetical protein